ncbi:MAG: response regulator [Leeuwenhoekiella sp.]
MKLLLVDDDPIFLSLLMVSLTELGYDDVVTATSGEEAMERLKKSEQIDCFLIDIEMDGMDGIELCQNIRKTQRYRDAVVVMVTARRDRPTINSAFKLGASGYLSKPINLQTLNSCLDEAAIIWNRNKILVESRTEIDAPLDPEAFAASSPYNQIEFRDIPNVIRLPAMMNYLGNISREMIFDSMSLQFQLPEYSEMRAANGADECYLVLADAAEAISIALRAVDPMITYTGGGRFVAVIKKSASNAILEKAKLADGILNMRQAQMGSGVLFPVSISVAELYIPTGRAGEERDCLLTGAASQSVAR